MAGQLLVRPLYALAESSGESLITRVRASGSQGGLRVHVGSTGH